MWVELVSSAQVSPNLPSQCIEEGSVEGVFQIELINNLHWVSQVIGNVDKNNSCIMLRLEGRLGGRVIDVQFEEC